MIPKLIKENNLFFLIIIFLLSFFLFNYLGLITSILAFVFSKLPFGRDIIFATQSKKKHGINKNNNSRLGGVVIILIFVFYSYTNIREFNFNLYFNNFFSLYTLILLIVLIGIIDDMLNTIISSKVKLYLQILIVILIFYYNNELVFKINSINSFSNFLDIFLLNFILSIVFCLSFMNATNMSDGANGLLIGIAINIFYIFYLESNLIILLYLIQILGGFMILNILYGKIYLGDTGSYTIGVTLCLVGFYFTQYLNFSLGFFACSLSYICIEFSNTIYRRFKNKKSIFISDDFHFHNLLYKYLLTILPKPITANSISGLIINLFFTAPSLLIYHLIDNNISIIFWICFIFQFFMYIIFYAYLRNKIL